MWKSMLNRGHSRIVETIQVAAAGFFLTASAGSIIPGFHSDADYFVTFIIKHKRRDGTVRTPTHYNQNFSFTAHKKSIIFLWALIQTSRKFTFYALFSEIRSC